jgi:glycosyltransferase involved in cell wall biosynthesis
MKILMLARRYPPDVLSGTETVFENLYARARKRHDVRLLVGFRRSRDRVPAEAWTVDLRSRGRIHGYVALWAAAWHRVLAWRPDVVLSNSIEAPLIPGVPTVCIIHDLNFGGRGEGLGRYTQLAYYRMKTRGFTRVVTVSDAMRGQLLEVLAGISPDRVVAIRNGVDLERFVPPPVSRPRGETLKLCYPSRILPGKAQHVAIDAVARMSAQEKGRVRLRIVGTSVDADYLRQLRLQAAGQPVEFHVDVPDLVPYYQGADIVLFPTAMSEGFGFTTVEAMACGRPVIHSDQDAIREATGGLGVSVPMNDAAALRDAIRGLWADVERGERLGREGRAFVEAHYAWDGVWHRYESLLRETLDGSSHGRS